MTATIGNVIPWDKAKRDSQMANEQAAKQALEGFLKVMNERGCRWLSITGYTPDNVMIVVNSHDICNGSIAVETRLVDPLDYGRGSS
jgi:hypothetical protein